MRASARILRQVQGALKPLCVAGAKFTEMDAVAEDIIRLAGAVPSFKGFAGFPATLCTMRNEEVVHGIPHDVPLEQGDLVSIDCGVLLDGWHADAAFSLVVGGPTANPGREKFQQVVYAALQAGCGAIRHGVRVGDVGGVISQVVRQGGYSICKEFTGHGLGQELHEDPHIFNYGNPGTGTKLLAGMTLAVEPIVARGKPKVKTLADKWTVVTVDGRDACQWEHCGVVTTDGFEIFV